jgi:glycosyltransferase involved in cell wall biosynthesis
MEEQASRDLSIVIPVYNEAQNLEELHAQIVDSCRRLGKSFEIIFIDDGSRDNSYAVLKKLRAGDGSIRLIRLRKNFGQTAALSAGFDHARGEVIITLDADQQNDPNDFGLLLDKIDEGFDLVNGWRIKRQDKLLTKRVPSAVANWLISLITRVKLHDYGCTLKALRRDVAQNINLYGEMHRFIPAIASHMGITIAEVKVNHRPRRHGKSNYTISRTIRVVFDLLTVKFLLSYSTRPLQIFGLFGLVSGFIGGALGLWMSYQRLFQNKGLSDRPLLLLAILLLVTGFQFITLGLLAEIMVRAYHESLGKHIYYIREIIDPGDDPASE